MIKIKNIPIGDGFKPFIVAEVSANHSGSLKNALLLIKKAKEGGIALLKGFAMGAANVIPGVSGGTMALITNIYEELIDSLKSKRWIEI